MSETTTVAEVEAQVEGTVVPENQERVVPMNQERVTPSWLNGKAPSIEEERAASQQKAEKKARKPRAAKPKAVVEAAPAQAPVETGKKRVLDAYLNAKTNTVTVYDRYAIDKRSGNRGHFQMPEFEAYEQQMTGEGWRVHRVKWESAVARAEKRDASKPKTFTMEQLTEFLAANPKITFRKAIEQLSQ